MTTVRNYLPPTKATRVARVIAAAAMALCLGAAVTACGKSGEPEPPPGVKKSDFPRPYPDPKSY